MLLRGCRLTVVAATAATAAPAADAAPAAAGEALADEGAATPLTGVRDAPPDGEARADEGAAADLLLQLVILLAIQFFPETTSSQ